MSTDMTVKQAIGSLTGFEVIAVERAMNEPFEKISGTILSIATMWTIEGRNGNKTPWRDFVKATNIDDIKNYFAEEESADPFEKKPDATESNEKPDSE